MDVFLRFNLVMLEQDFKSSKPASVIFVSANTSHITCGEIFCKSGASLSPKEGAFTMFSSRKWVAEERGTTETLIFFSAAMPDASAGAMVSSAAGPADCFSASDKNFLMVSLALTSLTDCEVETPCKTHQDRRSISCCVNCDFPLGGMCFSSPLSNKMRRMNSL